MKWAVASTMPPALVVARDADTVDRGERVGAAEAAARSDGEQSERQHGQAPASARSGKTMSKHVDGGYRRVKPEVASPTLPRIGDRLPF